MVRRDIDRRVPRVDATGVLPAPAKAPEHEKPTRDSTTGWEYHQDQRDKAFAIASLMVLGTFTLAVLAAALVVTLILIQIWQP